MLVVATRARAAVAVRTMLMLAILDVVNVYSSSGRCISEHKHLFARRLKQSQNLLLPSFRNENPRSFWHEVSKSEGALINPVSQRY
jgi:hypothetical protein